MTKPQKQTDDADEIRNLIYRKNDNIKTNNKS